MAERFFGIDSDKNFLYFCLIDRHPQKFALVGMHISNKRYWKFMDPGILWILLHGKNKGLKGTFTDTLKSPLLLDCTVLTKDFENHRPLTALWSGIFMNIVACENKHSKNFLFTK